MKLPVLVATTFAAAASSAHAGPLPQERGRVDLLTQANVHIVGARGGDQAGSTVAGAGDVNGDGVDDVIVGAPTADVEGRVDAGAAYVVFGRATTRRFRRQALSGRGFRIIGPAAGAVAGSSVAGAGDVNGDGLDDVVVGAPAGVVGGPPAGTGSAFVVYGRRAGSTVDLAALGAGGVRIDGGPELGGAVAGGRDVDGDARPDVVVSGGRIGTQRAFLLRGGPALPSQLHVDAPGDHGFVLPEAVGDVSLAADMTGDGRAEVVTSGFAVQGPVLARVAFGRTGPEPAGGFDVRTELPGLPVDAGLEGGGDVNGDGRGDLVIGDPGWYDRTAALPVPNGAAYVVLGSASTAPVTATRPGPRVLLVTPRPLIGPEVPRHETGRDVAMPGDVNGDGLDDVLVGASEASPLGRRSAGAAHVVFGRRKAGRVRLDRRGSGIVLAGPRTEDRVGTALAPAGDFNDDGRPDLLVGARSGRRTFDRNGVAYVVYGFGGGR